MYHLAFTIAIAFFVSLMLIHALKPVAQKIDLVDRPNQRKLHKGAVPLVGGIAISLGFCIGILALNISLAPYRALFAGYLFLTVIGIMDDFNELTPRLRIIAQIVVALLATCWGGATLLHLGHIFSNSFSFYLGPWAIPISAVALIALINANNMLDGVNGLAGGSSFATLACIDWIAWRTHAVNDFQILLILLSCVFAFLCFNFPVLKYRNRLVFLGDAGSTGLGLMMGWFGIQLSQIHQAFFKPAYLPWLLILPIFDLTSVTLRRALVKRVSPLTADREHVHHLLQSMRLRGSITALILVLFALAGGLISIFMAEYRFPETEAFSLFLVLLLAYCIGTNIYWQRNTPLPSG
ncbi:MAG: rfe [Gammaproteobacteria bacterium]|jgi:UDP-GlcNAc:undecaprenyl-phosphate GlcNAc-1-phosphate transferase|nr:rfe [Gammaproteobacteria bacterium]